MDRLTTFGLCTTFFLFGPMATFCCLLFLLYNGQIVLNYLSLLSLNLLFTYSLNGFFGLVYSFLSCLIMVSCGAMYWFDWSPSDLKNELNAFNQCNEIKYDDVLTNKNVLIAKEYIINGAQKIYQVTGMTDEKIIKMKNVYVDCSKKFDYLSDLVWKYMCNFYELIKDVKGVKELFYYFSLVIGFFRSIDSIKSLHKLSRNFTMGPKQTNSNNLFNQILDPDTMDLGKMDLGKMDFGKMDFGKMGDGLNNMSSEQKKSIDDMTKQIFENININDMMSMMQGFGSLMKPGDKSSSGTKNKKRT